MNNPFGGVMLALASAYLLERRGKKNGTIAPDPVKVKKPIAKRSEKRKKEQKEYVKIVKEKMSTDSTCEIRAEGCQGTATGLHHIVKRSPKTFLDKTLLIRACDNCNGFCEREPAKAKKMGFVISKFKP